MKKRVILSSFVLLGSTEAHAAYDPNDTFNAYVGFSTRYDSNLFRRDEPYREKDIVTDVRAGFNLERTWSKQKFTAAFDANHPWYSKHSDLNYNGWQGSALWNWKVGRRLSGDLSYKDSRTLAANEPVVVGVNNGTLQYIRQKDLFHNRTLGGNASYLIGSNWMISGGLERRDSTHSLEQRKTSNQQVDSETVSFGYVADTGHRLSAYTRWSDIEFDRGVPGILTAQDRSYEQQVIGLSATWYYSPKTQLDVSVGRNQVKLSEREKRVRGIRDFSTTVGHADLDWQVTAKTKLNFGYDRQVETGAETFDRNVADVFATRVDWSATAKTNAYLSGRFTMRDYEAGNGSRTASGEARDVELELGANTRPWRAVSFNGFLRWVHRSTDYRALEDYEAFVAGVGANWWF